MSIFKPLTNQRGVLLLIFVTITAIGGVILATAGPVVKHLADRNAEILDKAVVAAGDPTKTGPTNEEIEEYGDNIVLGGKIGMASGAVLNSASSVSPGSTIKDALGTGFAVVTDVAIGDMVSRGSNPAPTTSNPLPTGVTPPTTCNNSHLSSCTSSSNCSSAGGVWHSNNTCSNASCSPQNISDCLTVSDCLTAGGFWYDYECSSSSPICDSDHPELCTDEIDCIVMGGTWNDDFNTCDSCDSNHLNLCTDDIDCVVMGGTWNDDFNTCESCDSNHLNLCTDDIDCVVMGGTWDDDFNTCNSCDSNHLNLCTDDIDCVVMGGTWDDDSNTCNAEPQCSTDQLNLCTSESDCNGANGYWYNNQCNSEPENICGTAGTFTCDNGTQICADLACNSTDNCGDNSDEQGCGDESSCCVRTNGCPSETATSCGGTCCCCPYGQICDPSNPANGCVAR